MFQDSCGISRNNCARRDVLGYDAARTDDGLFSNRDATEQGGAGADRGASLTSVP
jgi:hypothetical protein